jgi:catechol 2,3-dioxygenase-like lactoylglutathione lyase family enzyme
VAITVHGVSELTLQVRDLAASERWYTDNLDLLVAGRDEENGFVWLKAGEWTRLGLWLPGEREFGDMPGAHVHFAMRVEGPQIPEIAATLRAKGLDVEGPVHHPGKDSSVYVKDPDGHLIEFFDYEPEEDTPEGDT